MPTLSLVAETVTAALVEVALPLLEADEEEVDGIDAGADAGAEEELFEEPEPPQAATTSATTPSSPTNKTDRSFIY
ncbi:MAG TPA: hypothetical protein VGM91_09355 [Conexibacter sp.]